MGSSDRVNWVTFSKLLPASCRAGGWPGQARPTAVTGATFAILAQWPGVSRWAVQCSFHQPQLRPCSQGETPACVTSSQAKNWLSYKYLPTHTGTARFAQPSACPICTGLQVSPAAQPAHLPSRDTPLRLKRDNAVPEAILFFRASLFIFWTLSHTSASITVLNTPCSSRSHIALQIYRRVALLRQP